MLGTRRSIVAGGALTAVLGGSLLLATLPAAAATTPSSTASTSTCKPVPTEVVGVNPNFKAGATSGIYVWHTDEGWSLRATHPGDGVQIFAGTVTSNHVLHVQRFRLEKNDLVSYSDHHHVVHFRFVNVGHVDGINFTDSCALNTSFSFHQADKTPLPADEIFLGATGVNPTSDPFTIQR
jgi:hypothetical protein